MNFLLFAFFFFSQWRIDFWSWIGLERYKRSQKQTECTMSRIWSYGIWENRRKKKIRNNLAYFLLRTNGIAWMIMGMMQNLSANFGYRIHEIGFESIAAKCGSMWSSLENNAFRLCMAVPLRIRSEFGAVCFGQEISLNVFVCVCLFLLTKWNLFRHSQWSFSGICARAISA